VTSFTGTSWDGLVDKPNKPQTSDEEGGQPAPAPARPARSPFRVRSRRGRQEHLVDPEPQVERPISTTRFDASPTTIAAAMAKAGASPDEVLSWGPARDGDDDVAAPA
jgi:hypothetical protein